jgi:hypothetical protein
VPIFDGQLSAIAAEMEKMDPEDCQIQVIIPVLTLLTMLSPGSLHAVPGDTDHYLGMPAVAHLQPA